MQSDWSDIFIPDEKKGRINYPMEIKVGRMRMVMGRILFDIRALFMPCTVNNLAMS